MKRISMTVVKVRLIQLIVVTHFTEYQSVYLGGISIVSAAKLKVILFCPLHKIQAIFLAVGQF